MKYEPHTKNNNNNKALPFSPSSSSGCCTSAAIAVDDDVGGKRRQSVLIIGSMGDERTPLQRRERKWPTTDRMCLMISRKITRKAHQPKKDDRKLREDCRDREVIEVFKSEK